MKTLEQIGFYTLSDERAAQTSTTSPLARCELILTGRCNFRCPYCRSVGGADKSAAEIDYVLDLWIKQGLKNVRFSGGEPTLHPHLLWAVRKCSYAGARVAISTNGSASRQMYRALLNAGVTDFSVSLDAGCCAIGAEMTGLPDKKGRQAWETVVANIRYLSSRTYTTVGVVFDEGNVDAAIETVLFAHGLGVADIRVIPSAQFGKAVDALVDLPDEVLAAHPILNYRVQRLRVGVPVRGIDPDNHNRCGLVLDDMAVLDGKHYPCIIHMREGGKPIGKVGPNMREERKAWMERHMPSCDPICSKNCLDVCVDYNRRAGK